MQMMLIQLMFLYLLAYKDSILVFAPMREIGCIIVIKILLLCFLEGETSRALIYGYPVADVSWMKFLAGMGF